MDPRVLLYISPIAGFIKAAVWTVSVGVNYGAQHKANLPFICFPHWRKKSKLLLETCCRRRMQLSPINSEHKNCLSAYANVKYLTTVSATCWKTALLAALVVTFLSDSFHQCQAWNCCTCSAFRLLLDAEERNDLSGEANIIERRFKKSFVCRHCWGIWGECEILPNYSGNGRPSFRTRSAWLMLGFTFKHSLCSRHLEHPALSKLCVF